MPPAAGLCARCRHARAQGNTRGSLFIRCGRAKEMPSLPAYPPLPVLACEGYEPGGACAAPPPKG